jgi:hypothetical protein
MCQTFGGKIMSQIKISDLKFSGSTLFSDEESYMYDLDNGDLEIGGVHGGCLFLTPGIYFGMLASVIVLN